LLCSNYEERINFSRVNDADKLKRIVHDGRQCLQGLTENDGHEIDGHGNAG